MPPTAVTPTVRATPTARTRRSESAARAIAAESSSIEPGCSNIAGLQDWSPAQLRHCGACSWGSLVSLIR